MKKFILVLLSCSLLIGWSYRPISYTTGGVACSTPSGSSILDEGFTGTGYENASNWSETGSGTIDEDTSLSSWPTEACDEGLNIATTYAIGDSYARYDYGSAFADLTSAPVTVGIIFRLNSFSIPSSGDAVDIFRMDSNSTSSAIASVRIYNNSGTAQLWNWLGTASSFGDISTGVIYRLILVYAVTESESTYDFDYWTGSAWADLSSGTFTYGATYDDPRYTELGAQVVGASDEIDITYGYHWID